MKKLHPALSFLRRLGQNNDRAWFNAHRDEYEAARRQWFDEVDRLIARLATYHPEVAVRDARASSYRINRDTRFSPDKSPYKQWFAASFSPSPVRDAGAGYSLQLDSRPGESGLYAGMYCLDSAQLRKMRHAIVDNIDEFRGIIAEPGLRELYGDSWVGPALKTIPQGWPKDHPDADLLRLKSYGKFHELPQAFFSSPSWPEEAADMLAPTRPLVDFINYSLEEEL